AVLGGVGEHLAHHPAQGLLGQDGVADVVGGHGVHPLLAATLFRREPATLTMRGRLERRMLARMSTRTPASCGNMEVEASVARCLRTPPEAAKTSGLQIGIPNRITRPGQPEHSCRWQL